MDDVRKEGPRVIEVDPFTSDLPTADRAIVLDIRRIRIDDPDVRISPPEAKPGNDNGKPPTPFDFNAKAMGHEIGKWMRVEVNMRDPKARFRADTYFVSAGDDNSAPLLRRGDRTADRIDFYVCRSEEPVYLAYNLGVIVTTTGGSELEIHIDPKIENGGG